VDAQALRERNLCGEMSTATKAIDTEHAAWRYRGTDQRPVADDARAEQWSQMLIVNAHRDGVRERVVN